MHDHVNCTLPLGPLGDLVHALWLKRELRHVFDFRREAVDRVFTGEEDDY